MLEYRIDRRSGMATYLQIVHQTKQALRLGLLEPGDKLPTAREVVEATA
ncbi:GntR family transcriptional regulator, partial [Streptomyces sp. WAC05950]